MPSTEQGQQHDTELTDGEMEGRKEGREGSKKGGRDGWING